MPDEENDELDACCDVCGSLEHEAADCPEGAIADA